MASCGSKRIIDELALGEDVHTWLEFVAEERVRALFTAADIVVLPYTHFDAQSAAGTLALSFDVPFLVSDVGGLPDLVGDPRAVVPANDSEALAEAMHAVLTDDVLRAALVASAGRRAADLDWGMIGRQTAAVYEDLMAA